MKLGRLAGIVVFTGLVLAGAALPALARPQLDGVRFSGDEGWIFQQSNATATVATQQGPYTPPLGGGSLLLKVGNGTRGGDGSAEVARRFRGGTLERARRLSYWTYERRNDGEHWPELVLDIDRNANGRVDDQLVFQPFYQTPATGNPACPDQGSAELGLWQGWNALRGCWWNRELTVGTPGSGVQTIRAYLSVYPASRVTAVHLRHGLGRARDRFDGNVDTLSFLFPPQNTLRIHDFNHQAVGVYERGDPRWAAPTPRGTQTGSAKGPGNPPLGDGSTFINVGNGVSNGNKVATVQARPRIVAGGSFACGVDNAEQCAMLSTLLHMSYWTHVSRNDGEQWPVMVLQVDRNGDGLVDDHLFFQPAFQRPSTGNRRCPDQGAARLNVWQGWTPSDGCWWNAQGDFGSPGRGVRPLSAYVVAHPQAAVISVLLQTGGGDRDDIFRTNVDSPHLVWRTRQTGILIAFNFE